MTWAIVTSVLVMLTVGFLVGTLGQIQLANEDDRYFRLTIRFWTGLAALAFLVAAALAEPVLALRDIPAPGPAGVVMIAFIGLPVAVVILGGLRNAFALYRARSRRLRAIRGLDVVEVPARVVDRERRMFANDILAVTVEARVATDAPVVRGHAQGYRSSEPERTRVRRFVETCPGDQWGRLAPGVPVRLRYDPLDPETFAVLLFQRD